MTILLLTTVLLLLSLSLLPYFLQGRVKTLGCGKSSGLQGKSAGYAVPLTLALSLALSLSLSLLLQGMRGLRNPPVSLSLSLYSVTAVPGRLCFGKYDGKSKSTGMQPAKIA